MKFIIHKNLLVGAVILTSAVSISFECADPPFGGFDVMANFEKIKFDTLHVKPLFLQKNKNKKYPNYYHDTYELNTEYKVKHYCSSYDYITINEASDTLEVLGNKIPLYEVTHNKKFRIFQLLKFDFNQKEYLLFIGKDLIVGGHNVCSDIIFLVGLENNKINLYTPPFIADDRNTNSYFPYYLNDFDKDGNLDFLQFRGSDTIGMFTLYESAFERRNEFVKLYHTSRNQAIFFIDETASNWPFPSIRSTNEREFKCQLGYEKYNTNGVPYYEE